MPQLSKNTDKHLEQRIDDNLDKSEEYSVENERITKELQLFGYNLHLLLITTKFSFEYSMCFRTIHFLN